MTRVSIDDVCAAAERLRDVVVRTPLERNDRLSELAGTAVVAAAGSPRSRVVGVEPAGAASMRAALDAPRSRGPCGGSWTRSWGRPTTSPGSSR